MWRRSICILINMYSLLFLLIRHKMHTYYFPWYVGVGYSFAKVRIFFDNDYIFRMSCQFVMFLLHVLRTVSLTLRAVIFIRNQENHFPLHLFYNQFDINLHCHFGLNKNWNITHKSSASNVLFYHIMYKNHPKIKFL